MKAISKKRKRELQVMFETIGNISDLKPVECWLVIRNGLDSVPESFKQRVKKHCEAVDLLFKADDILNIKQNKPSQLNDTKEELKEWPALYALEYGPETPIEEIYVGGMIDSPYYTMWKESCKDAEKNIDRINNSLRAMIADDKSNLIQDVAGLVHAELDKVKPIISRDHSLAMGRRKGTMGNKDNAETRKNTFRNIYLEARKNAPEKGQKDGAILDARNCYEELTGNKIAERSAWNYIKGLD